MAFYNALIGFFSRMLLDWYKIMFGVLLIRLLECLRVLSGMLSSVCFLKVFRVLLECL